ncbi:DUF2927 domain-containing protein [Phaeovulum vinaykumarii]|uniref:ATP-dependent transcriptional regulator n=1 Tax=Phaeovulum vinaykumarii TaxID=407234 RepID=A0A1N7M1T0_9RHOB|nr:DUF2927 domain-containing protein [Phaeovulum vinaykumarii]SIS79891.1 Protein of unknown function [Phaeovulum vinaykumarii]SOC09512.1 hypothetical protein SAMN05878426_105148 [Phaeovulum vinaykumarii]
MARASSATLGLPEVRASTAGLTPLPPARSRPAVISNATLARDFMELSFNLESGRALPVLTRFEGPVRVSTAGPAPQGAEAELARLIGRLRAEAGIDIAPGTAATNDITVQFVPRQALVSAVPNVACFVVPNVRSWDEYMKLRRSGATDWARLRTRSHATVFIPSDTAPQEVRDCLHEEIAQALGPLNDLYRLPDSVFNDDNFHAVLTPFDMKILRAYYAPELHSGLSAPEVGARLPGILARINPAGGSARAAAPAAGPTPQTFPRLLSRALGGRGSNAMRVRAARDALAYASAQGWNDTRTAFAWFALGRLTMTSAPQQSVSAFLNAGRIYRATPGARIQAAHVDMQLAALALQDGRAQDAVALVGRAMGPAIRGDNPALVATLHLIRAEAYGALGAGAQAEQARLDAASWARYGYGSDAAVRRRAADIAALARSSRG